MSSENWMDGPQEPRDLYDLAGLARLHPAAKDVLAGLNRVTAELNQHRAHWRNEVRSKAERLLVMAEQGRQVFSQDAVRATYDERLFTVMAAAFHAEFVSSERQHEQVRRWLRMTQNVHPSKLEEILRRLAISEVQPADIPRPIPAAVRAAPVVTSHSPPAQVVENSKSVAVTHEVRTEKSAKNPARPPPRPVEPSSNADHFGMLWIAGTAVVSAIVFVIVLFVFFGNLFLEKKQKATAQNKLNVSTEPAAPVDGNEPESSSAGKISETNPEKGNSTPQPVEEPKESDAKPEDTENKSKSSPKTLPVDPNAPPPPIEAPPSKNPPDTSPSSSVPPEKNSTPPVPPATTPNPPSAAGNQARQVIRQGLPVHSLAWSSGGDLLAVGGDGDTVRIWDVMKNAEAKILKESFPSCSSLAFGKGKLAAATGQGTVYVWNASTWKLETGIRHADMQDAKSVAWGNSGDSQLIVGDGEGNLRFLSVSGGNQTGVIEIAKAAGGIQSLVVTGKTRPVWITGHLDGTVLIWSSAGKNVMNCLANSGASVLGALAQPNAGASKSAQLTPLGKEVCYDLAVSPDEKLLAVAAQDVDLWELDGKNYLVRRRFVNGAKNEKGYRAAAFSSDSKLLAVGDGDGTLAIIDVASWTAVYQEKFPGPVLRIAWRPTTTRQLAVGCEDGNAVLITLAKDVTTGSVPSPLDPKAVLTEAQQNATDADWGILAQRISYLSIYRLPSSEKNTLDRLRLHARKGAQELSSSLNRKAVTPDELETAASTLQQAVDLDPTGEAGKSAREALRQLSPLTVAMLKASYNLSGTNPPGGGAAGANSRGGPSGRRAGGSIAPGIPAKPGRKK